MSSAQKNAASVAAAAALKMLWPDQYSGLAPMPPALGAHPGSASVSGLPSVWLSRMAVAGRQRWWTYFEVTVGATVSLIEMLTRANSRAISGSGSGDSAVTASAT